MGVPPGTAPSVPASLIGREYHLLLVEEHLALLLFLIEELASRNLRRLRRCLPIRIELERRLGRVELMYQLPWVGVVASFSRLDDESLSR